MASDVRYEPKFGRVLIKREVKQKTDGGILIPENAAKRHAHCIGTVVGLGETAGWVETYESGELKPSKNLNIGDVVIFGRHSGAWLDATYIGEKANDDGSLFICQDADILAVVKGA